MPRPIPPFYENWDDTHCVQCTLRGIIGHFEPDARLNWKDMDRLTGKKPGKWSWNYRPLISMHRRGYQMVDFFEQKKGEGFIKLYLKHGIRGALEELFGKEAAEIHYSHTDIPGLKKDLKEYLALVEEGELKIPCKKPSVEAMREHLEKGYLLAVSINRPVLNGKPGYTSHRVLVYDADDAGPVFHDSGSPGIPARRVTWEDFVKAATTPNPNQWRMTAYKKQPPYPKAK